MQIHIRGAREHNLQGIDVDIGNGLTVVTGVSGSGKTSLVFDTLYHEARRRFLEVYTLGSTSTRLSPANVEEIVGLGPAIAVGQNLLNRNPSSTLATASGLHPFFRLLFARFGERVCLRCGTPLLVLTDDQIINKIANLSETGDVVFGALLFKGVAGSHKTLLDALVNKINPESIIVDDVPWNKADLDPSKPHNLEIQLGNSGPRDSLSGLRHIIEKVTAFGSQTITIRSNGKYQAYSRTPVCVSCGAWFGDLDPHHFNSKCPYCDGKGCSHCSGTGLPANAIGVRWSGIRFTDLLKLSVDEACGLFKRTDLNSHSPRLYIEINRRLEALQRVGLGYLGLNRPSPTLSRGEAQRVRIALSLISRLDDMLHVLDEPTIGQHPVDIRQLLPAFRDLGGPVVFVEHDRVAAAGADYVIDLGPGAGNEGGRVEYTGTPSGLWRANTATGRYFSLRSTVHTPQKRPMANEFINIRNAFLRNLQGINVSIPLSRLTVITGVSGSGKSTLVEDVLYATLMSEKPVGCQGFDGPKLKPVLVDQSPIGKNPRSNPATYTKLADIIRGLFASYTGLSSSSFSFNRPEGACPTCQGLGAVEVTMRYLPSTWISCSECDGQRFIDDVLAARIQYGDRFLSIADFLSLSVTEVITFFRQDKLLTESDRSAALRILEALDDIGLGYLTLGQPSPTLSGGEAQRVKLARYLGKKSLYNQLLILDEPSTGLHPQDLSGLLIVLDRLVRSGATIVVVEHNTDFIRAADWMIDLGPGAGPKGGSLIYSGPPEGVAANKNSLTGQALEWEKTVIPEDKVNIIKPERLHTIKIQSAHSHNLNNVTVEIPKNKLTVITGVSGSGKSSLISDVLEVEARRRYLETLSMYERQGTREGAEAEVDSISGLGVVLSIGSERLVYSRRATVGSAAEITHHLAALFSIIGKRTCLVCGNQMERGLDEWICPMCSAKASIAKSRHFITSTYAAACIKCNGVGSLQVPQPKKLIIHPDKPLCNGAMYSPGFFPNGYLGKPYNGGYYQVLALAERYGFDPMKTPWDQIAPEAKEAFLFGDPEPLSITVLSRTGRSYTYKGRFPGFYGFIRDWDVGGTYTDNIVCPNCHGARLRPEYLAVKINDHNIHELSQMPLNQLLEMVKGIHLVEKNVQFARISYQTLIKRLTFLIHVGLGYLNIDRVAGTLSAGEAQRIRLASLLGSGLTSLTLLLDEPSRGLHPIEVDALLKALIVLRNDGNTVVVVEHDPSVIKSADFLIDFGPGAGVSGGTIVARGEPKFVLNTHTTTAQWIRGEKKPILRKSISEQLKWLTIKGARANNLRGEIIRFPLRNLVGVCGVSGSGKSTLLIDTIGRALAPRKQTTSVAYEPLDPGEYESIEGAPSRIIVIDQSRAGVHSPASFLGITKILRQLYAESDDAQILGIGEDQLIAGCSACGGQGMITLDMTFLPDLHIPCETCHGTGYLPEAWEVRLNGMSLPEVLSRTIEEVSQLFKDQNKVIRSLNAARDVGLGYLVLRQAGYSLSGGEAQRLKIAQELSQKVPNDTLYILDEPTVGQHLEDVNRLVGVLYRLVDEGGSVIVLEHHTHMLAACDWLVELGPGGGPEGGYLIAYGTPAEVALGRTPIAPYLREVLEIK